jgi:LysR family transcriptional regulator, regulatory protein for tcuABC
MDTRQLKYFVQIVESGSLSSASRQLFIAQPALSARVAKLEEEVGKPLLVRSVRGVVPTENGFALYQHAKFVLRQMDEAILIARQEYSDVKGRVTLGLAPSTAGVVGLPLLTHLAEARPGILLNVVAALPGHLEDMARAGQLDVAILFSHGAASEMNNEPLLDEDIVVVVPADSGLVRPDRTSLTLAEAAALPLVLSSSAHNLRRRLMLEFERARLMVQPVAEIDSLLLVMRYCLAGGRATVQPMSATMLLDAPERWRCLPISDVPLTRQNYLYALPAHKMSAAASIVRTELRRVVTELVEGGAWRGVRLVPALGEEAAAAPDLPQS